MAVRSETAGAPRAGDRVAAGTLAVPAEDVLGVESTFEGASNAGVVAGSDQTLVVDARLTPELGEDLRHLAERVADRPPALLVLTHPHGDHTFGIGAFAATTILSSPWTREYLEREWDRQVAVFEELRPAQAGSFRAARRIVPNLTFEGTMTVDLGGRAVRLLALGHGHTPGDVVVHVPGDGVVFSGDVVVHRNWPLLWDADVDGWLRSLDALDALAPRHVVPGHGPSGGPELIDEMRTCLRFLRALAEQPPADVDEAIAGSRFAGWAYPERVPAALELLRTQG